MGRQSVCLHMLCFFCPLLPAPRATCLGGGRANEHPWVGDPGSEILAPSALQVFDSSRASLLLIPSISPQYQQSPPGWATGRQAAAGSWEAVRSWCHISLRPCSRLTQQKVWLTPVSSAPSVPGGQIGGLV